MKIAMGDLRLPSRLATAAENLNREVSKERLTATHKTSLVNSWYLPGRNGCCRKLEAVQKLLRKLW